jgi:hypothetical protein
MLDEDSQLAERNGGHDRWLAMQSAYAEYRRASDALECTRQSADDSSTTERLRLVVLEGQQRVAFERYLEARMEFLEFRFDESNPPGDSLAALPPREKENFGIGSCLAFANRRPVLPILAVLLLCTTAFSLMREQKHVRDLETSRDELKAALDRTREGLRQLEEKVNASQPAQHLAIQPVDHGSRSGERRLLPTSTPNAPGRKSAGEGQGKRQPSLHAQKQVAANHNPQPDGKPQSAGARNYYNFSLAPSRQFKRIGPIEVAIRSVDAHGKSVSLFIVSDPIKLDVPHLGVNQPVWISRGLRKQPLEFVVDRIAGNRLDGHLIEPRETRPEFSVVGSRPSPLASP